MLCSFKKEKCPATCWHRDIDKAVSAREKLHSHRKHKFVEKDDAQAVASCAKPQPPPSTAQADSNIHCYEKNPRPSAPPEPTTQEL